MAGGRGVEHDQIGSPTALELLHLAEDEDVADARCGGGHHVEGAPGHEASGDPAQTVVLQVLQQGVVGGEHPGAYVGRSRRAPAGDAGRPPRSRTEGVRTGPPIPLLPSTSTMSVDRPASAAARAIAALTVLLPTPPFPATMSTRDAAKNCAGSMVPSEADRAQTIHGWRPPRSCGALVVATLASFGGVRPAAAQEDGTTTTTAEVDASTSGFVAVVKVSGLLDPVMVDFIQQSVADAEAEGALGLVLQANSSGVVVSDAEFAALLDQIGSADVPVDVWVGPSGSQAHRQGGAADRRGREGRHGPRHPSR